MKIEKDYLLTNPLAIQLYDAVKMLPLIDWHNHLSVKDLVCNRQFSNLTELWVKSDPYKHRAMRICGIPEKYITGDSSPFEKFQAWSQTLPQLLGNPLYDWSRLELQRVFGIDEQLTPANAETIWSQANERLKDPNLSAQGLLKKFRVEYAAPCANLSDDLSGFSKLEDVVPSLRGDDLFALIDPIFAQSESLENFRENLKAGLGKLHSAGCRFADHALDAGFTYVIDDGKNANRFIQLKNKTLLENERNALACEILRILCGFYAEMGWTLQLHIGALRRTSSRLRAVAGPAGGYAGIGHSCDIRSLAGLLDDVEGNSTGLPHVILYTLNPSDHAMFAVLSGSFPSSGERGKVTLGPAWWFCDHIHGMKDCFENVATYGVLSVFPGMTTDSRSLLSFVRHEYFRRVFCAWLAEKAARDEMPSSFDTLKELAENVCYYNAKTIISKGDIKK